MRSNRSANKSVGFTYCHTARSDGPIPRSSRATSCLTARPLIIFLPLPSPGPRVRARSPAEQEFKEKSRIFPWDQIFRSQPGPSLASYTVPPYIQSSGLVKSEIDAGGTLQYGAYDNTPRYPNNPNPNPQHAQASSMSLQMPMTAVRRLAVDLLPPVLRS